MYYLLLAYYLLLYSVEAFVVARDYSPPEGFDAAHFSGMTLGGGSGGLGHGAAARGATEEERRSVPFVACGDLGGYDVVDVEEAVGLGAGNGR